MGLFYGDKKGSEKMNASRGVWTGIMLFAAVAGLIRAESLTIQARGSYFNPTDQVFRDIYGNGMSWGGELGFRLTERIGVWAGGDYFSKVGKLVIHRGRDESQDRPSYRGREVLSCPWEGSCLMRARAWATSSIKKRTASGPWKKATSDSSFGPASYSSWGRPFSWIFQGAWSTCSVRPLEVKANLGGFSAGVGLGLEF